MPTRLTVKLLADCRPYLLINRTFLRFPVAISATICVFRYTTADAVVQISANKGTKNWDYRRSLAFSIFALWIGVFYGKAQTVYYTNIMTKLQRLNWSKIRASASIGLFDSTLVSLPMYFLPFYTIQEYCHSHQFNPRVVLQRTWNNALTDITASLSFYGPVTTLNMFFVPRHLRAIFSTLFSWLWSLAISKMRGRHDPAKQ